jgi:hypothetical protein
VFLNGTLLFPFNSQQVYNHSPDGFNWGYSGSGPAQLALAILLECTDKQKAIYNYQNFKREHIAALPQGENFFVKIDITKYI